jgi:hypothetical protein
LILKSHSFRGVSLRRVHEEILIDNGSFSQTPEHEELHKQVLEGIKAIVWPPGNDKFVIPPGSHVNGVVPIKRPLIHYLVSKG